MSNSSLQTTFPMTPNVHDPYFLHYSPLNLISSEKSPKHNVENVESVDCTPPPPPLESNKNINNLNLYSVQLLNQFQTPFSDM